MDVVGGEARGEGPGKGEFERGPDAFRSCIRVERDVMTLAGGFKK